MSTSPSRIRNYREQGVLELQWPDGEAQVLAHQLLRLRCPCAFCLAQRLREESIAATPSLRITALQSFGYGVQLVFSDGHDRGIFPWTYLRGLGPEPSAR